MLGLYSSNASEEIPRRGLELGVTRPMGQRRCVVTGAAGFIGSNLVRALLDEGWNVVGLDNMSTGRPENLRELTGVREFTFIEGDIRDASALESAFRGADVVFHQAALGSVPRSVDDPWTTHDHNVNGTLNALLAVRAQGVRRFVYAGSSSVYGDSPVLPKTEAMPANPLSPYAVSKYVGELYCGVFARVYGLETVTLRYFNVFGPRQDPNSQYAAVIPRFISALASGKSPTIFGDGEQTRDFTYVDNVVQANILAATVENHEIAGCAMNIGCGGRYSVNELLREIQQAMGTNVEPNYVDPRPGDVRDSQADIKLARTLLGYKPEFALPVGLKKTVEWFLGNGRVLSGARQG